MKPRTEEPKKETMKPKEVTKPKEPVRKPEKTEAEKVAEAKRSAEEKVERRRRVTKEIAGKGASGVFGKGAQMVGNKGIVANGAGARGSKEGDSSIGAKTGAGGYEIFDLGRCSLGTGNLLEPAYSV